DANRHCLSSLRGPTLIECFQALQHLKRGLSREQGVVFARCKRSPVSENPVPDELVGDAFVLEDNVRHLGEVFIEQCNQLYGVGTLAKRGEIAHVRKENRQLALFAGKINGVEISKNVINQSGRDVAIERTAGTAEFASSGCVANSGGRHK